MISDRISHYIPPNENFEYCYLYSNALLLFPLILKRYKQHKAACHPTNDVINGVKPFPTVYRRIYCHKFFLTFYNQMSRYKSKCIRICFDT